jgi:hypothetical protein
MASITVEELRTLTKRLRAVTADCGDCDYDGVLAVFATVAAEHGWNEALTALDDVLDDAVAPGWFSKLEME